MNPVMIPTHDVNSELGTVVAWLVSDGDWVDADADLLQVETSKAILDVVAPKGGYVLRLAALHDQVDLGLPVALIFDDLVALRAHEANLGNKPTPEPVGTVRASVKAIARARELGVDLASLGGAHLITVKDVEAAAEVRSLVHDGALPDPLPAAPGVQRVVVIGAGRGATQVIDVLADLPHQQAVAIVDDRPERWGVRVGGVPVIGGPDRLAQLLSRDVFDAVVIAISRVGERRRFRLFCEAEGIPLTNAIDKTAKIAHDAQVGVGNVFCAFSHVGTEARVGDNNFFSAYTSFDHHCVVGNDSSTGPACFASSRVSLGDQVRLGTGIHIEPGVELGDRVQVASGATIVRSVPPDHAVKTKVVTTMVVPSR
jgi:acetyltransferase-like isoleucine patch superfamily enzyme